MSFLPRGLPIRSAIGYIRWAIPPGPHQWATGHREMRRTECASSSQAWMPSRVPTGHGAEALLTYLVAYSILFCLGRPITRPA